MLPDFIIVGTMKAGTTSLAHYLKQHPQIFMPNREVHFFNNEDNYKKGVKWYKKQFKKASNDSVIGEKTPTYSYLKKVPKRIHDILPEVKLIWIFRNPVDRTYSNYWHAYKKGMERLSFEKAIKNEKQGIKENIFYGYKKRSIYVEQVKRYLKFFPKNKMFFYYLRI